MPRTLLAIALLTTVGMNAQQAAPQPEPAATVQLLELQNRRNQLIATTERLRDETNALQYRMRNRREYDDSRAKLTNAQGAKDADATKHWQAQVEYYASVDTWNETNTIPVIQKQLKDTTAQLIKAQQDLSETEVRINRLTNIELLQQDFKTKVSYIFGGLVGILIVAFFWVVLRDETVRRHVFAGHAGIQLITLFSIVIAIILFGITGILESKELSALLGSISGYVLGRVTTGTPSSPPSGGTPPPGTGPGSSATPAVTPPRGASHPSSTGTTSAAQ